MNTLAEDAKARTAASLAGGMDDAIIGAVTQRLGHCPGLSELVGRLRIERRRGDIFELLLLDNQPLLEIYDPVFKTSHHAGSWRMNVSQNFRRVPASGRTSDQ